MSEPPKVGQTKHEQGIRVIVEDLKTGDKESAEIIDEYIIVCAGSCYLAHQQVHANGTVQLTIKGRK